MAVLDFSPPQPAQAKTPRLFGQQGDRPRAKLWLNVGYEVNGKFVNLPVGIPLDTMEPAEIKGQNKDWVAFQSARNGLLKALVEAGSKMEPGAAAELPQLTIQIRRVNEDMQVPTEENEYAVDLVSLLAAKPIAPAAPSEE